MRIPLSKNSAVFYFSSLLFCSISSIVLVVYCFATTAFTQNPPIAVNNDFYVVDKHQHLEVYANDANGRGNIEYTQTANAPIISIDFAVCPFCMYVNPTNVYSGFDFYTYRYVPQVCCGAPPDPPSDWATVGLLFIGNDDVQNAGRSCPIVGKPVNVTNGNMWLEQQDYVLPGRGEIIEITRFYNSINQSSGLFGIGWSTKFDESLQFYGDKMIRLNQPDGRAAYFGRQTTAVPYFSFSPDVVGQIVQSGDGNFTLTYQDGSSRLFNQGGRLTSLKDRNGNETTLAYDFSSNLIGVTDSAGRTLTVTPNANGTVAQISDSIGVIADYEYFPGTSRLKTVTYLDGSKYKFEYNTAAVSGKVFLATVKDALDQILETHAYDSQGRATTSETDNGAEKFIVSYTSPAGENPDTGLTTVTDANGKVTKYYFKRKYGTNLITKTEGLCSCGGGGSEVSLFYYDDRLNLVKKVDAEGRQTIYTYDSDRNVTVEERKSGTTSLGIQKWTYNSRGQVLTYKDQVDQSTTNNTVTNTFDSNGNLLTTTDRLGNTTTMTYTSQGQLATVKDARNNTTTLTYDSQGRLAEIKDANNKTTNIGYDARARVTSVTNAKNETTSFTYDLNNRPKRTTFPDTNYIEHTYDLAGRRTATRDARGNSTTFGYDAAYRLTSVTDPLNHATTFGYDLMSNMTSQTDAIGNVTNLEYDDFNRLKKVIYPAAASGAARLEESVTYDKLGNVKTRIDTAGRATTYDYDVLNRLIKITDADNKLTHFEYNLRSQLTKVKDALNQEYIFTYDPLGRVLSQTRAGTTMAFEYDPVGNRTKRTDYAGRVTNYEYDVLNRLKKITYVSGSPNTELDPTVNYTYDELSRLLTATNSTGTVTFTYDSRNRLKTETDVWGRVIEYGYDANSNRTQLKLDGMNHATYAYDNADRLTTLTDDANQNFTFGYDIANRLISKALPNGVNTTYEYDGMSRLKRLKHQAPSGTVTDNQYSYNAANQMSQIAELSQTKAFMYDNVDRLTSMTNGTANESYTFDGVGNRTSSHLSNTYTYQPFNKLTATQTTTQGFDANGNTVWKSEGSKRFTYTWDYENRLGKVNDRKTTVRHWYDALGRRVMTTGGRNGTTKYTYTGLDVVMDDSSVSGITKYQNGPGIDNKLSLKTGSDVKYLLQDHLGSTIGLTDSTGTVTASQSYDSFGSGSNASFPTRYQYTGREYDSFSNLYYYRARFYDPKLGRFISEDPIGFRGGNVNLYGYVQSNSINQTDPLGTFGLCRQPDGTIQACGPKDLARALGSWNPWISVDFQGSAHFLTAGGTVSTGFIYNPLTCELCQTSKTCVNWGGGGFIGAGPQLGLQRGPYRGADKLNIFEETSDMTIEGGEGLGLGLSGTASKSGLSIGIKPELATGAYVGSNQCTGAVTHCYFSPAN